MDSFQMNGYSWKIKRVSHSDPMLVDRTNVLTVATTDPETFTIYLSEELYGDFLIKVFIHELGHCALYSFDLIRQIHRMVYPEYWIEAEEFVCNFIADYGFMIFSIAYKTIGTNAWKVIPKEIENWLK